jgi:hypothetical protein
MEKLHFSTVINAPRKKVWNTMLGKDTYKKWTSVFAPDSQYEGDWNKGSKILFLDGKGQGMVSRIAESKPYEFVSIEHLVEVHDGKEDTESDAVKTWAGAHENYTLKEKDGKTELLIDLDSNEEFRDMFEGMWPKALQRLKEIAEE